MVLSWLYHYESRQAVKKIARNKFATICGWVSGVGTCLGESYFEGASRLRPSCSFHCCQDLLDPSIRTMDGSNDVRNEDGVLVDEEYTPGVIIMLLYGVRKKNQEGQNQHTVSEYCSLT